VTTETRLGDAIRSEVSRRTSLDLSPATLDDVVHAAVQAVERVMREGGLAEWKDGMSKGAGQARNSPEYGSEKPISRDWLSVSDSSPQKSCVDRPTWREHRQAAATALKAMLLKAIALVRTRLDGTRIRFTQGDNQAPRRRFTLGVVVVFLALAPFGFLLGRGALLRGEAPKPAERAAKSNIVEAPAPRPVTIAAAESKAPDPVITGSVSPSPASPAQAAASKIDMTLKGVPEVLDTATMRLDRRIIRLAGIEWAKGGQSEDLNRYLRGREVQCTLVQPPDWHRCTIEGRDLSEVVLYNGGARATADAPPDYLAAESRAKSERIGVWRR
jgi:endonuclease YncB( thermonuclease family)